MKHKSLYATPALLLGGLLMLGGCGSSGGSSSTPAVSGGGGNKIVSKGGTGGLAGGSGGSGGYFEVHNDAGGNVEVRNAGRAKASFTATNVEALTPNLGDHPITITTDTTFRVLSSVNEAPPASGVVYLVTNSDGVWESDGDATRGPSDSADERVTGISVEKGVTLTLELNYSNRFWTALDNALYNMGTITTEDVSATQRGGLSISAEDYYGGTASALDTRGTKDGQSGGDISISSDYSYFNAGAINTSGADGTASVNAAGDGGDVDIWNDYFLENTGNVTTAGGTASSPPATTGGDGGYFNIYTYNADLSISGDVDTSGGDGVTAGGNGAYVKGVVGTVGDLRWSGDVDSSGGDATAGSGGNAGNVLRSSRSGGGYQRNTLIDSNIIATGGSTTDAASNGGKGGYVEFYTEGPSCGASETTAVGDLIISGAIDTSGGNAATTADASGDGGNGGDVYAYLYAYYCEALAHGQKIAYLGYDAIDTSGGDGNNGGDADYVDLYTIYEWNDQADLEYALGSIINEADIDASGGDVFASATSVTNAYGGTGGDVNLYTEYSYIDTGLADGTTAIVSNKGDINTSGGTNANGVSNGNNSGASVLIWGYNGISNSGNITANGGGDRADDGGNDGYGGWANDVGLYTELALVNSGNLSASGGDGEYYGGDGGNVYLYGGTIRNTGDVAAEGGDADTNVGNSSGGDGGWIELWAAYRDSTNSGSVSAANGAGTTAGTGGAALVLNRCVFGDC